MGRMSHRSLFEIVWQIDVAKGHLLMQPELCDLSVLHHTPKHSFLFHPSRTSRWEQAQLAATALHRTLFSKEVSA